MHTGEIKMDNIANMIDKIDRSILNIIQSKFPLESHPYFIIGKQIGITEEEAFERIKRLRKIGIIRRIGANFDSAKLGFKSTLCAAKVSPDKLDNFIATVNECPGVTHNYLRSHEYNVWFTLIDSSWEELCTIIDNISIKTGVKILNLPKTQLYKIKVNFKMEE